MNEVLDLFPTRLNISRHDDSVIVDEINHLVVCCEKEEPSFNFNAEQNDNINLFDEYRPILPVFLTWLTDAVNEYVGHEHWRFSESWLNIYTKNGSQPIHNHKDCQVSGCYYHQTVEEHGDLITHNPNSYINLDVWGCTWKTYPVKTYPKSVVMFPSFLMHSTENNMSDLPKISIGFNVALERGKQGGISGQWLGKHTLIHDKPYNMLDGKSYGQSE